MELTIKGELMRYLFALTKQDTRVAQALAWQWIQEIDPTSLHAYLLSADVAQRLLADRLKQDPEGTLMALGKLPPRTTPPRRRGRPPGRRPAGTKKTAAKKNGKGTKRPRYGAEKISSIKQQIHQYLAKNPWSNRKSINKAVKIPSQALYHRIMTEMRDGGLISAKGQKSKTVYAAKGRRKK
jgi:hypothetical protein